MGLKSVREEQKKAADTARKYSKFWSFWKELGLSMPYVKDRPYSGRSSGTIDLEKPGK